MLGRLKQRELALPLYSSFPQSAEGETNYWDSVDMIEDGNAADNEGNNENTADEQVSGDSEEYPGQDDGWSPIVPADDVN